MAWPETEPEGACLFQVKVAQAELSCLLALALPAFVLAGQDSWGSTGRSYASVCFCFSLALGGSCFQVATVAPWEAAFQNQKLSEWILQQLSAAQGWHRFGVGPLFFVCLSIHFLPSPHWNRDPREQHSTSGLEAAALMLVGCRQPKEQAERLALHIHWVLQFPNYRCQRVRPPLSTELLPLERWEGGGLLPSLSSHL